MLHEEGEYLLYNYTHNLLLLFLNYRLHYTEINWKGQQKVSLQDRLQFLSCTDSFWIEERKGE